MVFLYIESSPRNNPSRPCYRFMRRRRIDPYSVGGEFTSGLIFPFLALSPVVESPLIGPVPSSSLDTNFCFSRSRVDSSSYQKCVVIVRLNCCAWLFSQDSSICGALQGNDRPRFQHCWRWGWRRDLHFVHLGGRTGGPKRSAAARWSDCLCERSRPQTRYTRAGGSRTQGIIKLTCTTLLWRQTSLLRIAPMVLSFETALWRVKGYIFI